MLYDSLTCNQPVIWDCQEINSQLRSCVFPSQRIYNSHSESYPQCVLTWPMANTHTDREGRDNFLSQERVISGNSHVTAIKEILSSPVMYLPEYLTGLVGRHRTNSWDTICSNAAAKASEVFRDFCMQQTLLLPLNGMLLTSYHSCQEANSFHLSYVQLVYRSEFKSQLKDLRTENLLIFRRPYILIINLPDASESLPAHNFSVSEITNQCP